MQLVTMNDMQKIICLKIYKKALKTINMQMLMIYYYIEKMGFLYEKIK